MPGYSAGDAFIRILPDFSAFFAQIRAEMQQRGTQAGRDFADAFNRAVRTGNTQVGPTGTQSARQGTTSGGAFADAFKRRVEASLRSIPPISIGAATGPAEQKIRDLKARLDALRNANIGVDLDAGAALAELRALQSELTAIAASATDIKVKADTSAAAAQLAAFEADLKRLSGDSATVDVRLSGGFAQRVKAQIAAALENLPEAVIGANSTQVDAKLAQIRAELGSLRDLEIGVDIDAGAALARIAAVQTALVELRASNPTIDVDVDAARAQAELAAIEAEITALGATDVKVPVDTSSGIGGFQALLAAGILLAPALIPIGAAITAAFAGIAVATAGAAAAIGVVALAVIPVVKAIQAMSVAHKAAGADGAKAAKQQADAQFAVQQANQQVASAEASLANTRANAASQSAAAARAVVDAKKSEAKAVKDAAEANKSAAQDVADANEKLQRAEADVAKAAQRAARDVADAKREQADTYADVAKAAQDADRAVADATRAQADTYAEAAKSAQDAARVVADAEGNVASVTQSTARAVEGALQRQADAERALESAQRRATDAQKALTQARQDAQDRLEDLQSRAANGALDERDAVFDLTDKTEALRRTRESLAKGENGFSQDDVDRALLKYDEAVQKLEDIRRENQRVAEEKSAADAKGVEGSDLVVGAQQGVADATAGVVSAQKDAADAAQALADARLEQTQRVARAERDLQDAITNQGRVAQDNAERTMLAERAVADAVAARTRVTKDNAERTALAERAVTDAITAQQQQRVDGVERVADAERRVTEAVKAERKAHTDGLASIEKAQERVTGAALAQADQRRQAAFSIAQAEQGVENAQASAARAAAKNVETVSKAQRDLAQAMSGLTPAGQSFVNFLFDKMRPALKGLSAAAQEGLLPGLQKGLENVLPLLPGLKGFVKKISATLGGLFAEAGAGLNGSVFQGLFGTLGDVLPSVLKTMGSVIGNLAKGLAGLFTAVIPLGLAFGDSLNGTLERFANWAATLNSNDGFKGFVEYAKESLPQVGAFLGNLFQALGKLIAVAAPFGVVILAITSALFDLISKIPTPVLAGIFIALGVVLAVVASGAIATALAFTALGIGITYLIGHFDEIKAYITDKLGPTFTWLNEKIVQPVTKAIVSAFTNVRDFVVGAVNTVVSFTRDNWPLLLAILTGPIGLAVLAITKNWGSIRGAFSDAWTWVQDTWSTLWGATKGLITKPIDAAQTAIGSWSAGTGILGAIKAGIDGSIAWVKGTFKTGWDVMEDVFKAPFVGARDAIGAWDGDGRGGILGGLHTRFDNFVKGVGEVWGGLRALTAEPIKFIIDTVLNDGLIAAFNWVAGKLPGGDKFKLDRIAVPGALSPKSRSNPSGYASGGVIAGPYLGPAADNVLIRANPDEYMQPVAAHRYYGTRVMDALRSRAIPADVLRRIAGFARGGWIKPVKGPYGEPFQGVTLNGNTGYPGHTGQDFPVPGGTPVVAVAAGRVTRSEDIGDRSYGRVVEIDHGGGLSTLYAHMSQLIAQQGQQIAQNALVGLSGNYGNVRGAGGGYHLHFEVKENKHAVNPLPFLEGAADPGKNGGGLGDFVRDLAGKVFDPIGALTDRIAGPLGKLGDLASGSYFGKLVSAVPQALVGALKGAVTGLLPDLPGLGTVPTGGPNRDIGKRLAAARGWDGVQWNALNQLWTGESGWNERADNPTSSAYGIPQALPGSKMASVGADWRTNPETQIRWGLDYIDQRYGSPEIALQEWLGRSPHWYDDGGYLPPGLSLVMNGTGKPEPVFTDAQFAAMTAGDVSTSTSERAYHYHAAEGRSMPEDDFLESAARAQVLFAGW